jgi:ATP-binding cassette, subfamily B, bacterial
MARRLQSSRLRFAEYRERLRKKESLQPDLSPGMRRRPRVRSTTVLIRSFFRLLGDQRPAVYFALGTLTISTILGLGPPASTKFVVDNVLGRKPLPRSIPSWLHIPTNPWGLSPC